MTLQDAIGHLEVGDWEAAHKIVQEDSSPNGCWAHGIVHILEGDLRNARYWYRRADRDLPGTGTEVSAGEIRNEIGALKDAFQGAQRQRA